jgi:hypothetical protein
MPHERIDRMRFSALAIARKLLLATAVATFLALASAPSSAQDDPTEQAGRLSYVTGAVSIQPAGIDDWGLATSNLPLGPGDRIFTDSDGRAEIQVGETYIRIGPNSDVIFVDATPSGISFGLAQGSIHLHTLGLWQGQEVHVNTPSGSVALNQPGELRVDVPLNDDVAIYSNLGNDAFVSGAGGFGQDLGYGHALELIGSNPVFPQWLQPAGPDSLDSWSQWRDQQVASAVSYRYVSPEIAGADELDANGTWQQNPDYGPIWFPNNVPPGWAPYHYGHWINHAPWGWVWVEDEAWGYAPFHYGRWVVIDYKWGWVPGPPSANPVWSPALVVFAGGIQVGGAVVSAWFPLGPGEAYHPWYPASPRYIDQVNISNIRESRMVHVRPTYVNYVNLTFANHSIGVTAMRHEDFAAGRPARQVSLVVDIHLFDHVQVLAAPEPRPTPRSFISAPPARPVPVRAERPALINESGKLVAARPGAQPVEPPVRPAPHARPVSGRTVIAAPAAARSRPVAITPAAPVKPETRAAPATAPPAASLAPKSAVEPARKPVVPTAPKPAAAPVSPPAPMPRPAPVVRPVAPSAPKPAAAPAAAKPGAAPAPKSDKDKKGNKDKTKDDSGGK